MGDFAASEKLVAATFLGLTNYGDKLALNFMRGKRPYKRVRRHEKNKKRRTNQQSVEMSALEIDQSINSKVSSKITGKSFIGGHPDRTKRHSSR